MKNNVGRAKYVILVEELRQKIRTGEIPAGEKLPSEYQLVEQYEVSRHTVRKALSILENEGLVEAIHGKGTFCKDRRQNRKPSKNVAVVTTYISDYIFPRVLQGMEQVLTDHGYSIILKNTKNSRANEARILEELLQKNIDGLIVEPAKSQIYCGHMQLYKMLDEYEIPYIFIHGIYDQMRGHDFVRMDDCLGGYLAAKHLLDLGHRQIVGIFKADDIQGKERHKGYVRALQEAGCFYDPDKVIWYHTEDRKQKPVRVLENLLKENVPVHAVVCYNDQIAVPVVEMLLKHGYRVPEDISVTGYDDSYLAESCPVKLTTIAHPQEELGAMAAECLLRKLNGAVEEQKPQSLLIRPKLIIRDSSSERKSHRDS